MYDGEECDITLSCENLLMKSIVDRFGEKVSTSTIDENHFSVMAKVSLSPTFYGWVFSFEGKIKIISPDEAVTGFESMLKCNK